VSRVSLEPYEIEHVLADDFERDGAAFDNSEEAFQGWRNSFGALVLLPRDANRSFGALPYWSGQPDRERPHPLGQPASVILAVANSFLLRVDG
jgi:hypothetical protein